MQESHQTGLSSEGSPKARSLTAISLKRNVGCAIALLAGYSSERKLAGIAGLSGWLPLSDKFQAVKIRLVVFTS